MTDRPARPVVVDEICDYCDQPAELIGRDSGDVLCPCCGKDQYSDPGYSLAKLTPTTAHRYNPSRY
jgi:predicted amidophosphoribosyltransferase